MLLAAAKIVLVVFCVILVTVILFQSGRSAGLSGVITGGSDQASSRRPKGRDALLGKITVVFGILFFILTLFIAYINAHQHIG